MAAVSSLLFEDDRIVINNQPSTSFDQPTGPSLENKTPILSEGQPRRSRKYTHILRKVAVARQTELTPKSKFFTRKSFGSVQRHRISREEYSRTRLDWPMPKCIVNRTNFII